MKKLLSCAVVFTFLFQSVSAQTTTFGIKAGIQSNFLSFKNKSDDEWSRNVYSGIGVHAGGVADIALSPNFSIQPNLLFSMKGVRPTSLSEITIYTIDLPINFLYKTNGFFAGVGPNLSYGLSAKSENDGSPDDDLYEADGGQPAEFNRFEFGANAVLGYQCASGLTVNAHWTPGFSNLNNQDDADEERYNTRIFGLSVGYMFNSKRVKK